MNKLKMGNDHFVEFYLSKTIKLIENIVVDQFVKSIHLSDTTLTKTRFDHFVKSLKRLVTYCFYQWHLKK